MLPGYVRKFIGKHDGINVRKKADINSNAIHEDNCGIHLI
jgi:hypothetical protein